MDIAGVNLEKIAESNSEITFSVRISGGEVGRVNLVKYYAPTVEVISPFVALWAGPTLCVIDHSANTMRCIDRDDETHRIHLFEGLWIVEGELRIDLFDPRSAAVLATYAHNEVITGCALIDGFVHVLDFYGVTTILDPHRSLEVVRSLPNSVFRQ